MKNFISGLKISNFLLLTIAGFINAFGVTVFLAPVKLYDSGVSGTSMLLSQVTPEFMTLSFFLLCALFGGVISGIGSGMTKIAVKGGYSNSDKTMIYFIVNRFQIAKMKDIVHSIDEKAYITLSEVADVFTLNQD